MVVTVELKPRKLEFPGKSNDRQATDFPGKSKLIQIRNVIASLRKTNVHAQFERWFMYQANSQFYREQSEADEGMTLFI